MRLIAHRGFAGLYPENTVYAVRKAAESADVVEVDVRQCASGEPVVVHDETVDRVTDGTGRVADLPLSALRERSVLDSGEPVPTLPEVLDAIPDDVGVNAELKERGVVAGALAALAETDSDVLVSSFDPAVLRAVGEATGAPTALLFAEDAAAGLKTALALDCAAVHPQQRLCTGTDLVRRAHDAGLPVHAWTVATGASAEALARVGVDGVIADWPDVLEGLEGG